MEPPKKKIYQQRFRKEWLEEDFCKDWIVEPPDPTIASCKYCDASFGAKLYGMRHHYQSKKHILASQAYASVRQINISLPKVVKSEEVDEDESMYCYI